MPKLFRYYNVPPSSPYVTCPRQCDDQAMLWTCCGIQSGCGQYTGPPDTPIDLLSLSPGVLKRISCSRICKSTGMDVRTRLLVTPSCLRVPLESPQLPPQHLTPCPARPPSWKSTAPLRVSYARVYILYTYVLDWDVYPV